MKRWEKVLGSTLLAVGLVTTTAGGGSASRPSVGRVSPPPSAPPPSAPAPASTPRSSGGGAGGSVRSGESQSNRRPSLFQEHVGPRPPVVLPGTPGHDPDRGHRDHYYYDPFYYNPYFSPGLGYGFIPYTGPFSADDYYYYGYGAWPYRSGLGDAYDPNAYPREARSDRRGNVALRIEPRDVDVYVDGILTTRNGRATLDLPTGRWHLEFVRPGYRTESVDLEVTQGVSYRVERKLERLRDGEADEGRPVPATETGELQLDLRPDDAIVYLDGRALGLASDLRGSEALRRLPPGRHVLEARRPGYATFRREIVISPAQPATVHAELKPE